MAAIKCVVGGAWIALGAAGLCAQTSLSIYSDGRVVVRRTVPQPLTPGRNTLRLQFDDIDGATLFSPDSGVSLLSVETRSPSDRAAALEAAVGQTLAFVRGKGDTVRATVLSVAPSQYRLGDGRLLLSEPGEPLFTAELVRTTPEVSVVLEAQRARPRTELAYVSRGAQWAATYQVVIGRAALISGSATITTGARADSAAVQLVAGAINDVRRPTAPEAAVLGGMRAQTLAVAAPASEEAVGETHVYEIPSRVTLEPGVPLTVALFPRATAPHAVEYVVPGVMPWRGYLGSQPTDPTAVPVGVWYTIKRAAGTAFGDRPLPAGTVQLYQPDSAGRVQLVGEAAIDHTPAGKDVRVETGTAFDVTAERVQTDYGEEQLPPARRGLPPGRRVTASYKVTLHNAKTEAVTVDVREDHFGTWRVTESSVPAEKLSSTESRFRLTVPASGDATLTYTMQVES